MAVVVAPAIGPTLGGWITDNYSWRWIFYINVPISLISLYLTHKMVEDPPYLAVEREKRKNVRIDYIGLGLVALGIGMLQMVMDKGQELDWFGSHLITAGLITSIIILIAWVWWEWRHPNPIVELHLLKRRNVAAAMFFMLCLGMVLYGTTVLLPEFTQNLLGYPAVLAGEALAGGGFMMMFMMPLSGALTSKTDPRYLMAFGFLATSIGLYYMSTHLTLGMDFRAVFMLRVYQVAGLAFIFIPSNVLSYSGVPSEQNNQLSSMINFVRNIGGSIGIAVVSTLVTRSTQQRSSYMSAHLQNANPNFRAMISGLAGTLQSQGMSATEATRQAYGRVEFLVQQQAAALAFKDVVSLLALLVLFLVPVAFIMQKPQRGGPPPPAH